MIRACDPYHDVYLEAYDLCGETVSGLQEHLEYGLIPTELNRELNLYKAVRTWRESSL